MAKVRKRKSVTKAAKAKPAKKAAARATSKRRPASSRSAKKTKSRRAPAVNEAASMAAWERAMTPADGHKRLDPLVGTFETKISFWMAPGAPPNVGTGISDHRWVLGGRYVEQVYRGTSMGMPFEGIGYTGYDNARQKYVGTWMDSMGTGIMNSVGSGKPSDKEIPFSSTSFEPARGKQIAFRSVVRISDRNRHSYEMWTKAPNGKEFQTLRVEYTRK